MIRELTIKDVAIIDRLTLEFSPGLNVLTGETGAGKSIILGALTLVLGERAHPSIVRRGAASAEVTGLFDLSGTPQARRGVEAAGLPVPDGELLLRREVSAEGKGRCFANGKSVTLAMLSDAVKALVDLHGQHEHQALLKASEQVAALDRYAGAEDALAAMASTHEAARTLRAERERLAGLAAGRAERLELTRFQAQEIRQAELRAGEEAELERECGRLRNAERLAELAGRAAETLLDADGAVVPRLKGALKDLEALARLDPETERWLRGMESLESQVADQAEEVRKYRDAIEADPRRLDEVQERLERIARLKKKYGGGVEDILARGEELEREIREAGGATETAAGMEAAVGAAEAACRDAAAKLTRIRREAAARIGKAMRSELDALGMSGARFEVEVSASDIGPHGADRVEFRLAPNPGEGMKPLAVIASGGELSRVMLGLKTVLAGADHVPTLVFDEIDTGIGGGMAQVVGDKLRALAERAQVVCITHLPQIARAAAAHFRVGKRVASGRTVTEVSRIAREDQVAELARMLGGGKSDLARRHAQELLKGRE